MPQNPNPCYGATLAKREYPTSWYGVRQPFLLSNKSLIRYAKHFKHTLVIDRQKDPPGPTFDEDAVEKLIGWYPDDLLYPILKKRKQVQRCKSLYVDGVPIGADGRVHTTFSHNPTTLRLSSYRPNLQNLPRTKQEDPDNVYIRVKEIYHAAAGCILGELDFSGIEAQIVAYLANDPVMLRLTKLGVHAFFTSHRVGRPADLSWSDEDLSAYFAELKKTEPVTYDSCKRVVHGTHYLMTPNRMNQLYPKLFPTKKDAKFAQDFYLDLFPKIGRWQWDVCREAAQHGYITAPDGFRQWFFESIGHKRENGKWVEVLGREAKECVAGKPQHMAMCFMAQALIALGQDPLARDCLRVTIHDAILWECPEQQNDEVTRRVRKAMEQPMTCMPQPPEWNMGPSLLVKTEGKKGKIWAFMK